MPRTSTPLVGRVAELATLHGAVDDATAGVTATVLVSGDAGVGKTRVLAELVAQAHGVRILIGHCLDIGEAGLPYLPFTEIFGRLATEAPDLVDGLLGRFPPLARLLPSRSIGGSASEHGDQRIDRSALFDAVLGALTTIAADQPVLVVIEDVHWADQSTRDLIGFLLARLSREPVAVLVSYRSDDLHRRHPLRSAVAQWHRLPSLVRLHLAPLGSGDVRQLIRVLHPVQLPEYDVACIVQRAEGNAFFTEELVAAFDGDIGLPAELADLLLVRLDRLSSAARNVVRVAAVAGRRVPHELLATIADLPDSELDAGLHDAVDSHILEAQDDGRYGFRHALLAESVYADLLPGERVRLHAAYAAALAKADIPGTAAELARHALESHDLSTAFSAGVRAGDEAMHVAAPDEALQHYETALQLLPHAPDGYMSDGHELVTAAAEAASAAGHHGRAVALVRDALADSPTDLAPVSRATLLHAFARYSLDLEADQHAMSALEEAVRLLPPGPPTVLRAQLLALQAHALSALGRDVDAERWAHRAIETASGLGRTDIAADAETTLASVQRRAGDPAAATARLQSVAQAAHHAGDVVVELRSTYVLGMLHFEQGDLSLALDAFRTVVERARQKGRQWAAYGIDARLLVGLVQYVQGDWDASLRTATVAGEQPPEVAKVALGALELIVRSGRGDLTALSLLDELRPSWQRDGMVAVWSGGAAIDLYAAAGRVDEALDILDETVATVAEVWDNEHFLARIRLSALGVGALASNVTHQSSSARTDWVRRGGDLVAAAHLAADRGMPAARVLGAEGAAWLCRVDAEWARLRWSAGVDTPESAELVDSWRAAVDAFGWGHVYEQARSRARLAAVLQAVGDGPAAQEQADLARVVARRLGAAPLQDELRALALRPAAAAHDGPAALTTREREVLGLLVQGRTNRQLARQLYISEKTVSVHVSSILAKLGVGSRTEAAAIARRDGLA